MVSPSARVKRICLLVLGILVLLVAGGSVFYSKTKGEFFDFLQGEARCIHEAAKLMAEEAKTNHDIVGGWPGDLKNRGEISSLSDYVNLFVRNDYFKSSDLKVFAGVGYEQYLGTFCSGSNPILMPAFRDANSAFRIYLVKESDPPDTAFIASKNSSFGNVSDSRGILFGKQGFVVVLKNGNSAIYKSRKDFKGTLPGGGTVESPENCLNP